MTNVNVSISISSVVGSYTLQSAGLTLKLLILNGNVKHLPDKVGDFFPNLQYFGVVRSSLEFIRRSNFYRMDMLKSLDLRQNKFSAIPDDAFIDLVSLRKIDLSGNLLKIIQSIVFTSMNDLSKFIANENLIDTFDSDTFRNNAKLTEIHLWRNKIKTIEIDVKRFKKLIIFDVRENVCVNSMFYLYPDVQTYVGMLREIGEKCSSTDLNNYQW